MDTQYRQGFSVPQLFVNVPSDTRRNAKRYIDFARQAASAIEPGIIQRIATHLGLSFVPEKEKESEVCFINSEEVRPEFRLSFAPVDLTDYILGILHHSYTARDKPLPETDHIMIPYPKDSVVFWEWVEFGEKLRRDGD